MVFMLLQLQEQNQQLD
ncbi:hypothetical protein BC938DRAFT_476079 [Jimgerdemannia flammicorona]|uniref:Uncharacterized protein n=1 Tax=Jimgerdemannia flammicorona TaxID=994334 RepID=A0A433PKS8_9FUNG|nr:hypothetical protein BC938DRAFT_476079 [Jimgerdemannia flammicorona]